MPARIYDAKHWRDRAEEATAIANGMRDPEAKRIMTTIAAGYTNLAEQAELAAQEAANPVNS